MPGLDALYDAYSFNVIPALGRAVTGDGEAYRYLVESIRRFPRPGGVRRHDARRRPGCSALAAASSRCIRAGGCEPCAISRALDVRARLLVDALTVPTAPPPLAATRAVISALAHLARLAAPASCSRARACSALIDPKPLPLPARMALRIARLFERRATGAATTRLSAALTRLGPTYVKLGQFLATRPDVVGIVLARDLESLQDKMAPFPQAEAETRGRGALGKPLAELFVSFGPPVAAASIAQVHHAEVVSPDGPKPVAVKVLRPGIERRFAVDLDAFAFAARNAERFSAEARRLRLIDVADNAAPHLRDRDGPAARGRRALRDGGEHPQRSRFPRAGGRLGPHRAQRADARMDRRHSALRPRAARSRRASISRRWRAR